MNAKILLEKAIQLVESSEPPYSWSNPEHGNFCPYCALATSEYESEHGTEEGKEGWELLNHLSYRNVHSISFSEGLTKASKEVSKILEAKYIRATKEGLLEVLHNAMEQL